MNKPPTPPEEHEELVHADDAIIGKAARWSLLAIVALVVVAVITIAILKRKPAAPPPRITQLRAPTLPEKPKAEIPPVKFTDISAYLKNSVICPSGGTTFANSYTLVDVATKPVCQKVPGAGPNDPLAHTLPPDTGA